MFTFARPAVVVVVGQNHLKSLAVKYKNIKIFAVSSVRERLVSEVENN